MKKRTTALLLAAALALSLLGVTALAAEGGPLPAGQAQPAEEPGAAPAAQPEGQGEEPSPEGGQPPEEPVEEYIPDPVGSLTFANLERRMREGSLQVMSLQENIDMLEEIDYDVLKEEIGRASCRERVS